MIRILLLLTVFLFSSFSAYAADYVWTATFDYRTRTGSSPDAAAQAVIAASVAAGSQVSFAGCTPVANSNGTSFSCKWADKNGYSGPTYGFYVNRSGDSCPAGLTYDSSTGVCGCPSGQSMVDGQCVAENPCTDKVGSSIPFSKSGSIGDGFFFTSGSMSGTSNSGCMDGCEGSISGAKCRVFAGEPGNYSCAGSLYYSGQQCTTGSSSDIGSADSPVPPDAPPTTQASEDCGSWITTAEGESRTCISTTVKDSPGSTDSGSSPSPSPSSSTDETTKVEDKKVNADGSTTTKTTTTTNNTYCTVGKCTTTTTTNTTITQTAPGGSVTGTISSCTGANCGKPTNSTGTGSGSGGDGDSDITVTGSYSGNLAPGEQGSFDAANVYWDEKIAESKELLRVKLDDMKAAVTATTSPTLSGGAGGLPCGEPITFGNGYSIDLCFSPYEGSLEGFKAFILFLAAVIAFYIVFVRS